MAGFDEVLIDGPVRLCFREYRDLSVRIARGLISCGARAGDGVVIWAPNSVEVAVSAMAVASAGAVLVPLNTRFTAYEAAELIRRVVPHIALAFTAFLGRDYLASLRPSGVLDEMKSAVALRGPASPGTISLDELLARGESAAAEEVYDRERALSGNDISDILFTSGTTGSPKGAMLRHGAGTRGYTEYGRSLGLRPGDRLLGLPPFFHCFGLKAGSWPACCSERRYSPCRSSTCTRRRNSSPGSGSWCSRVPRLSSAPSRRPGRRPFVPVVAARGRSGRDGLRSGAVYAATGRAGHPAVRPGLWSHRGYGGRNTLLLVR